MNQKGNWYLVQCKPRQDERAEENLVRQGYLCVRPTCVRERISRGKRKVIVESLFPGYIFIHISDGSYWAPLRSTRGVSCIVSFGGRPIAVADELVAHFQQRSNENFALISFQVGEKVRIVEGRFVDLDAIFMAKEGDERVVLLINLLSHQQQVTLPLASIEVV